MPEDEQALAVAEVLEQVSSALREVANDPTVQRFSPFLLRGVSTSVEAGALLITYQVPLYVERYGTLGVRRHIDLDEALRSPEALARKIVFYDIQEPLGRWEQFLTRREDGYWWWEAPVDQ